jgi:hypothetical protein
MKTRFSGQKIAHIIGEIINNIDKSTYKQLLKVMRKQAENRNYLRTNNMLVQVKNTNQEQLPTPLLSLSKKVLRIAGIELRNSQSSSTRSLAGFALRSQRQKLADRKSPLRNVYKPIYFPGEMKPKKNRPRSVYEPIYFPGEMKPKKNPLRSVYEPIYFPGKMKP